VDENEFVHLAQGNIAMNTFKISLITTALILVLCTALLAPAAHSVVISSDQINWLGTDGNPDTQNSDWGQVNLAFNASDIAAFTGGLGCGGGCTGFVNVVTTLDGVHTDNWAVKNMPIFFRNNAAFSGRLTDRIWFDLAGDPNGPGGTIGDFSGSNLNISLTFDSVSLADPSESVFTAIVETTVLGSVDALFGGLADPLGLSGNVFEGGTGQAAPAKAQNFVGAEAGDTIFSPGGIFGKESDIAKINEGKNQCAPASAARSLKYLADQHPSLTITDSAQDVHGDLVVDMKTTVKSGTTVNNFLLGKDKYASREQIHVKTRQTTDVLDANESLNKKADVEMMVYWGKNAKGESLGGHAAFISQITKTKNAMGILSGYTVNYIDDGIQGDGIASNVKHSLSFAADGSLKGYGKGAGIIGFQVEVVPEPGTSMLMLVGLIGFFLYRRR
jgi:hypothetical protein